MHPPRACCGKLCEEPNPADIGLCRTLQRLSGVGGSPKNLVNVISYVTLGYSQKACRTSIRNNTGNSESRLLTSGPPPCLAPPMSDVSGCYPDWRERPRRRRRRCGECSKNIPGLYGIKHWHFRGRLYGNPPHCPSSDMGGAKPRIWISLLSEGGFRRAR